jgi:erythromycin esterase
MTIMRLASVIFLLLLAVPVAHAAQEDEAFLAWARTKAIPLEDCVSIGAVTSYARIAGTIGNARLVALGEPVHGAHEPLAFRNCLFRYLVEERGFTAIAIESGLHESRSLHEFAAGGPGELRDLARTGFTWGFGRYSENIELLEWMRDYNLDPRHSRKIAFYGMDMSGGDASGEWARARVTLDTAMNFLARAAPAKSSRVRSALSPFLGGFTASGNRALSVGDRHRLRSAIGEMARFFDTNRKALTAATSPEDYDWAHQNMAAARQLETLFAVSAQPGAGTGIPPEAHQEDAARDAAMAENALWAFRREGPHGRLLLFAHSGHVMNDHTRGGVWSAYPQAPAAMGLHLRRVLGRNLLLLGMVSATRAPDSGDRTGSIDASLAAIGPRHFLLDLRSPPDSATKWLARERSLSVNYDTEQLILPQRAFDAFVYIGELTRSKKLP